MAEATCNKMCLTRSCRDLSLPNWIEVREPKAHFQITNKANTSPLLTLINQFHLPDKTK
jgi:hypothetical protein